MGKGLRPVVGLVVAAAALLATTGCGAGDDDRPTGAAPEPDTSSTATDEPTAHGHGSTEPGRLAPLRKGERRVTLTMDTPYTPAAPADVGTDDYRCFLLDPKLEEDAFITGTHVLPGNPRSSTT